MFRAVNKEISPKNRGEKILWVTLGTEKKIKTALWGSQDVIAEKMVIQA